MIKLCSIKLSQEFSLGFQALRYPDHKNTYGLRKQWRVDQILGTLYLREKPRRSYWPPNSVQLSCGHCSHMGNEPADERPSCSPKKICLSDKNNNFFKIQSNNINFVMST